ncbi:MAG: nitroreductase family deazaflavin-dependent oxidoreductase [Myxococcales bacterium]|nr:nitroreductase family deazaflavin-dependent oxidoreductase [Myxococcales bacterium]MDH3845198.1 nitroreductase family deazaflavin-dependent oxidoreductase [Myxococcales bacterium]
MSQRTSGAKPRSNIVAGQPVKWRVIALDRAIRPLFWSGVFRGMGVLTTTGRKTGKPRRHAVRAIRDNDRVYVVVINGKYAAWLHNLRDDPGVQIRLGGANLKGTAHELGEGQEREEARRVYVGTVNGADYLECILHWRGLPRRWKIQKLHEMWFEGGIPLVIKLD